MAKMEIELACKFQTEKLEVTEDFKRKLLEPEAAIAYFSKCQKDDLALYLVALKEDFSDALVSFEMYNKHGKKGASINIEIEDISGTLQCSIDGKFSIPLRSGVAEMLSTGVNFAVQGVCYKGGSYRGFMAYVKGQTEGHYDKWMIIDKSKVLIK